MRRASLFAALAACALVLPATLAAQDLSGSWELTWKTPRGTQTVAVTFVQDGMNVDGTLQMRMGEVPIKNGMIHGDELMFDIEMTMGDRTMSQAFHGIVTGDTMEGTVKTPRGETPFKGKRKQS